MKVGIAGAGLVGRLLAWQLVQRNITVTLFDRDTKSGQQSCGLTAAGMLAPFAELDVAEPLIFEYGLQAAQQWADIIATLPAPVFLQRAGSLLVAHTQDHNELDRLAQRLARTLKQHNATLEHLDQTRIHELEPTLANRFQRGLYFSSEAQLSPQDLFLAFEQALETANVTWHEKAFVTDVTPKTIISNGERHVFDWVFDCRGLGAKESDPDLRGVRGELITLHAPEVTLNRLVRLLHPRYPLYIAPRPDHHFIVGASTIESDDHSPISVQTTLELLSAAYSLHPGFAEARIVSTATNCRPAYPDHLPRLHTEPGLTRINGLYRHGYLLAPTLVQQCLPD